jgi:hypothetical protein
MDAERGSSSLRVGRGSGEVLVAEGYEQDRE